MKWTTEIESQVYNNYLASKEQKLQRVLRSKAARKTTCEKNEREGEGTMWH